MQKVTPIKLPIVYQKLTWSAGPSNELVRRKKNCIFIPATHRRNNRIKMTSILWLIYNVTRWSCYVYCVTPFSSLHFIVEVYKRANLNVSFFFVNSLRYYNSVCACVVLERVEIPLKLALTFLLLRSLLTQLDYSSASSKQFTIENSPLGDKILNVHDQNKINNEKSRCQCYVTIIVQYDTNTSVIDSSRFQTLS